MENEILIFQLLRRASLTTPSACPGARNDERPTMKKN